MSECSRKGFVFLCATAIVLATAFAGPGDLDGDGVPDTVDVCSNTPAGVFVDDAGRPIGDHDADCDVDLGDLEWFVANFTGPLVPVDTEVCDDGLDNDGDDLIDCADDLDCPLGTPCSNTLHCSQFATCGCPEGTGDCDVSPQNGCETDTEIDVQNCGQCDYICETAHGFTACETGECAVDVCDSGWCDVDGLYENGCEFNLNSNPLCSVSLPIQGSVSGDMNGAPLSIRAQGERWFRMHITENNDGIVYLSARFVLESAAGTNYDLYVYCQGCASMVDSSTEAGIFDEAFIRNDDDWGSEDGFDVLIEIRWISGSCGDYTLTIDGDVATNGNNCDP